MKKLTFLVFYKEYEDFLNKIRDLGVIHVAEKQHGILDNADIQENLRQLNRFHSALVALEAIAKNISPDGSVEKGQLALSEYDQLLQEKVVLEQRQQALLKDEAALEPWGDFQPESIERLTQAGYQINFFTCQERLFNPEWVNQYNTMIVNRVASKVYFLTVTAPTTIIDIDAELCKLPRTSLSQVNAAQEQCRQELASYEDKLISFADNHITSLKRAQNNLQQQVEFSEVVLNTEEVAEHKLMLLQGWAPVDTIPSIKDYLDQSGHFYEITDPQYGEDIPILLKNNWFAKLFEPITELYSLPNYSEIDPTAFLAPFFMLFFGLCLGDGGYGLLILVAATIAKHKAPKFKSIATLGQFLGGATMVVGLLTGVFFGVMLDGVTWPWLANVKHYFITSNNYASHLGGYDPMMLFAIAIGVVQILFAMGIKIAKITIQHGFKYAISDLGWLIGLLVLIALLLLPLAGVNISQTAQYVLYGIEILCGLTILFYNSPDKNIFANFGSGLWGTYNMVSGLLGDVLSYIRLFALGLAGGILGSVFNSLALDLSSNMPGYIGWLPMLLVLLFGHSLNIALCVISSIVHPLRLTFVEFYKNEGFEGGGKTYKPFQIINK